MLPSPASEAQLFRLSSLPILSSDPIRAVLTLRGLLFAVAFGVLDRQRMRQPIVESFVPPRVVRLNDDRDNPVLAIPNRTDVFITRFRGTVKTQRIACPKCVRFAARCRSKLNPFTPPTLSFHVAWYVGTESKPVRPNCSVQRLAGFRHRCCPTGELPVRGRWCAQLIT